jgi:DNA-binding LacI/PurR family transcriptional regulator
MASIKDIAKAAGVSIGTVSRALNNAGGMTQVTRERILSIAKRLKYQPNLQARGLVGGRPNALGIVIPQMHEIAFSNPFFAEILIGIGKKAREAGQYLVFSIAGNESYTRMFQQHLVAGMIVLANRIDDPWVEEAYRSKVPIVLIPGNPFPSNIPSVDFDNIDGAFQAVDYLAKIGHRRIAFLYGPGNLKFGLDRLVGYRKALKKNGISNQKELVWEFDATQQGGYKAMKRLLVFDPPPTAVLVLNDFSAMGVLRAAKESGFQVPRDISIIGFGDVPLAAMTDPPLTTVREPFHEMGYEACERLLKIIQGKRLSQKHLILPVELVIRKTTAPAFRQRSIERSSELNRE